MFFLQKYMAFKSSSHQNMLQRVQTGAEHFGWKPITKGKPCLLLIFAGEAYPLPNNNNKSIKNTL